MASSPARRRLSDPLSRRAASEGQEPRARGQQSDLHRFRREPLWTQGSLRDLDRPLDAVYPILYLDALQVKVKSQGRVVNKAIYIAFGVNLSGLKEVLGMWRSEEHTSEL